MDPQAVIAHLCEAASDPAANRDDIKEAAADLHRWLKGGGFLPTWDARLVETVKGLVPESNLYERLEWVLCVIKFRLSCGAVLDPITNENDRHFWPTPYYPYWVRLDDRGDLMLWVFAQNSSEAIEAAEEWARFEDIEINEEDVVVMPVDVSNETRAILDFRLALLDKAGEE